MTEKEKIISLIEQAVSLNILGDKQFSSRFKGFIGELDFPRLAAKVWPKVELFAGGFLVSTEKDARSTKSPVYFNIGTRHPDYLIKVFENFAKLECSALYYFQFDGEVEVEKWAGNGFSTGLVCPPFEVFEYDEEASRFELSSIERFCSLFKDRAKISTPRNIPWETKQHFRGKLDTFPKSALAELYFQRLVFDTLIGGPKVHGIPSDVDFVGFSRKRNAFVVLEVKEKDKSKRVPRGFGMDVDRINDLLEIQERTGMLAYYVVREVEDQEARNFLGWRAISLNTFSRNLGNTLQGGSGMGFANGRYPTQVCPAEFFQTIE